MNKRELTPRFVSLLFWILVITNDYMKFCDTKYLCASFHVWHFVSLIVWGRQSSNIRQPWSPSVLDNSMYRSIDVRFNSWKIQQDEIILLFLLVFLRMFYIKHRFEVQSTSTALIYIICNTKLIAINICMGSISPSIAKYQKL